MTTMTRYYLTVPGLGGASGLAPDVFPRLAFTDGAAWRAFSCERRRLRKALRQIGVTVRPGDISIVREADARTLGWL